MKQKYIIIISSSSSCCYCVITALITNAGSGQKATCGSVTTGSRPPPKGNMKTQDMQNGL